MSEIPFPPTETGQPFSLQLETHVKWGRCRWPWCRLCCLPFIHWLTVSVIIFFKMSAPLTQKTKSNQPQTELSKLLKHTCRSVGRWDFSKAVSGKLMLNDRRRNSFLHSHVGPCGPFLRKHHREVGWAETANISSMKPGWRLFEEDLFSVFPLVMRGCENWTISKAEHRRIDAFKL